MSRKFPDRAPGTMAHQRAVGGGTRINQPSRTPIRVVDANGEEHWVPANQYDKQRATLRKARQALHRHGTITMELVSDGHAKAIAEVLAWSKLESEVDPGIWTEARRLSEKGELVGALDRPVPDADADRNVFEDAEEAEAEESISQIGVIIRAPVTRPMTLVPTGWPVGTYRYVVDESGSLLLTPEDGSGD